MIMTIQGNKQLVFLFLEFGKEIIRYDKGGSHLLVPL